MSPRTTTLTRAAGIAAASLLLLTGCWTQSEDPGAASATSTATAAPTDASTDAAGATAPATAGTGVTCAPGDGSEVAYTCAGVTVTGAQDSEPTIELDTDFAPVDQLVVADIYEGSGDAVTSTADTLEVNYVGMGQQSREVFDSSWSRGTTATFALSGVIQGWQDGLIGMKAGGRRLLVIPGSLGYGDAGAGDVIKPDETLVFVVDLVSVTPAS